MKWKGLQRSQNVSDRRGGVGGMSRGATIGGGGGLIAVVVVILSVCMGGNSDVGSLLGVVGEQPVVTQPGAAQELEGVDEEEAFIQAVLGTTEEHWNSVFSAAGREYQEPALVLFTSSTPSACGGATSAVGPHYCPLDQTIYVDLDFFDELVTRFGATGGDFAQAYVIAHEVGHHVQNELDIMDQVQQLQQSNPADANALSVNLELQADCLAGTWAHSIFVMEDVLEPGDIEEALDAAAAVGDDRIQERFQGSVNPESWTHGSAEQRQQWFNTGYQSGDPSACDTFSA
jgi:predicted metalloprotease